MTGQSKKKPKYEAVLLKPPSTSPPSTGPDHFIPPAPPADFFNTIHQGEATNKLARIKTKITDPGQLDLYGNGVVTSEDFKVFIKEYEKLSGGVRPTAKKLLDALIITATESGQTDTMVRLPLAQYMQMRGLRDVKEARKQVRQDIEALDAISIEFREKRRGKTGDYLKMSISGGTNGLVRGVILFRFNTDFFNVMLNYPVMPFPKEILRLNSRRNPNSEFFLRRIAEHKNMNIGKPNEDIIGVKTLLLSSPELPRYADLGEKGQVSQRIIDPFERDMDALDILEWNYCGKNGTPCDPPKSYAEFERARVRIVWKTYPERLDRGKKKK